MCVGCCNLKPSIFFELSTFLINQKKKIRFTVFVLQYSKADWNLLVYFHLSVDHEQLSVKCYDIQISNLLQNCPPLQCKRKYKWIFKNCKKFIEEINFKSIKKNKKKLASIKENTFYKEFSCLVCIHHKNSKNYQQEIFFTILTR